MWEFPECVKININDLGVSVRKVRMDYVRILMHLYLGNSCLLLTGGSICLLRDAPTHPEAQPRGGKVDPDSTQSVDEERNYGGGGGAVVQMSSSDSIKEQLEVATIEVYLLMTTSVPEGNSQPLAWFYKENLYSHFPRVRPGVGLTSWGNYLNLSHYRWYELGVSLARCDYPPLGTLPPHSHPPPSPQYPSPFLHARPSYPSPPSLSPFLHISSIPSTLTPPFLPQFFHSSSSHSFTAPLFLPPFLHTPSTPLHPSSPSSTSPPFLSHFLHTPPSLPSIPFPLSPKPLLPFFHHFLHTPSITSSTSPPRSFHPSPPSCRPPPRPFHPSPPSSTSPPSCFTSSTPALYTPSIPLRFPTLPIPSPPFFSHFLHTPSIHHFFHTPSTPLPSLLPFLHTLHAPSIPLRFPPLPLPSPLLSLPPHPFHTPSTPLPSLSPFLHLFLALHSSTWVFMRRSQHLHLACPATPATPD
ncbi:hypothetical protein Pcinc_024663 [Petrolisthes cinctipes]|uniref:Uncharacterized protein n=1 Tax=Petrolisthes cinctipes TaxID=88211 RepID=A0AAE1KCN4_PETCI|nr:hypothetical protein Pcinc_024663 [Petrolisthes cinctipes]